MNARIIIKKMGKAVFREFAGVNTNNFARKTDAEIIAAAQVVLGEHPKENLRPYAKKVLSKRFLISYNNAVIAGTILWAELCGWKPKYLKKEGA